ncbi:hypothetical protein BDN72DRAFT_780498, partial [Pluteus cervinus]
KKYPSEGRRTVSWIWGALGDGNLVINFTHFTSDLRVEWCKSRARARRWQEDVILLKEEMRRVLMFLETEASLWSLRAVFRDGTTGEIEQEGLEAYAYQQAHQRLALKSHFEQLWAGVDDLLRTKANGMMSILFQLGLVGQEASEEVDVIKS